MRTTTKLKSLLVAAGICVGASVWAQTTLYERGTNDWSATDVADGAWSAGTIGESGLEVTNGVGASIAIAPTIENSILTWTATWNPGNATGTADNTNAYISFGDVKFAFYGSSWYTNVTIGSTTTKLSGVGTTRGRDYTISVTIDQKTKEVSYSFTDNGTTVTGTGTTAKAGEFTTLTHGLGGKSPNWTNTAILKAVKITEEENTSQIASYTVKYMCGTTELKETVTRSGIVGQTAALQATDKEDIYNADNTIKYVYTSDNAETETIAADGSTVIIVNFEAKPKFTYDVKAVDAEGKELTTLATVSGFEGETLSLFWSMYVKVGDKWYQSTVNNFYQDNITEAGEKTVIYKESDIAYFIECENMNGVRHDNRFVAETSASNSGYYKLRITNYYSTIYTDAFAEGGVFDLVLPYSNSNASNHTYQIRTRDASGNLTDVAEWTCEGGIKTYTLKNIVIPAGSSLAISCDNISGNSNARMDYLTLTACKETVSVAEGKEFATFNSDNALDFTGVTDVLAYTAKVSADGSTVTLAKVEGKVPANTGLLIRKGDATSANVPMAASADEVTNEFIAVTAANCDADQEYKTVKEGFILATVDGVQGFYKANSTEGTKVAKGKAYLPATGASGVRLMMNFGDETTGINEMRTVVLDNSVYNLNGVRVAQPTKGLYIVNGKKVIVK